MFTMIFILVVMSEQRLSERVFSRWWKHALDTCKWNILPISLMF